MDGGGGRGIFGGEVFGGQAVVNGVEWFGEDRGEVTDGDGEWVGGPCECSYGFAKFEEDKGARGAEEDMWPCGNVGFP
jgi:hypothetical protein